MFLKVGDHVINLDRVHRVDLRFTNGTVQLHFSDCASMTLSGEHALAVRQFFADAHRLRFDGVDLIDITPAH